MHNLSEWQSDLQSYVKAFHMGSETLRHLSNDSKAQGGFLLSFDQFTGHLTLYNYSMIWRLRTV